MPNLHTRFHRICIGGTAMKIGEQAMYRIVNDWLPYAKEGDKIVFCKNEAVYYNESHCVLDRISLIH